MFPSICELQPNRVSWGDKINWHHHQGEEIEAQLPWENDIVPHFHDKPSLDTFLVVIIYLATLLENQPSGDSTFQFWLSL